MSYVIGVDLGTSAVKLLLVDREGRVAQEITKPYPLIQEKSGYSEQDPEQWVRQTLDGLRELVQQAGIAENAVAGISFSGQMHGLVLVDREGRVLRNAILWNDTRTTAQCREIESVLGDRLLAIAKNPALEGFTLPKLLWVKQHEPELFEQAALFLLPKDYLRYRLTGALHMDYSDAAGTLLMDIRSKEWSREICDAFGVPVSMCPELIESHGFVGTLLPEAAARVGLSASTRVFAGGADNACGATGAGILSDGDALCSIGTSGVILTYQQEGGEDFNGRVHYFNHADSNAYYLMGVTLAAGYSLSWFRETFAAGESFEQLSSKIGDIAPGSGGLLYTPYVVGERTPYADANIRASFIGMDAGHSRDHFVRAIMEGITFSLRDSIEIFRSSGKRIDRIVSIGGGAKNEVWLQIQADIFNATIRTLANEQGPGLGAAMLAAVGAGWFPTLEACASHFIQPGVEYHPVQSNVKAYDRLYNVYRQIYTQTKPLNDALVPFRA
jgi:xylulokinase